MLMKLCAGFSRFQKFILRSWKGYANMNKLSMKWKVTQFKEEKITVHEL